MKPGNLAINPGAPSVFSLGRFLAPPGGCSYLPDRTARMEYEVVVALTPLEYSVRLLDGWRRFGHTLFRPRCRTCTECRSLRVEVARFRPDRSQRRNRRANEAVVGLTIGPPRASREALDLYRRYHEYQSVTKGWPAHDEGVAAFRDAFVDHPFPVQEWRFDLAGRLVGVGYVDALPIGLSAIYFFHDPMYRDLGLGTWNILSLIEQATARGLPHVYLGYYVAGCRSLAYKARFGPNQILMPDGTWVDFRS
jgi:arginine-tRNA-protein transferase